MYSMLEFFVQWVKDGMYDFHHLPFVMKRTLSDSQRDCIRKIPNHPDFKGAESVIHYIIMYIIIKTSIYIVLHHAY